MCSLICRSYCLLKFYCSLICIFVYLLSMFPFPFELLANFFWIFISTFEIFLSNFCQFLNGSQIRSHVLFSLSFLSSFIFIGKYRRKMNVTIQRKNIYFVFPYLCIISSNLSCIFVTVITSIVAPQVRRLLCSARPVAIQTSVNPSASDQDIQQVYILFHNEMTLVYFFT